MQTAKPGDTVIAYIDDSTFCIGVVISNVHEKSEHQQLRVLILGWFTRSESPPNANVFGRQKMHPFPSYEDLKERNVVPYDFEQEIEWCRSRDKTWWESLNPPCFTNLIATLFSPKQFAALRYIATARHFLSGGTMKNYSEIGGYNSDEDCLKIWATLYCHFPNQVVLPPKEMKVKNSNIWYLVSVEDNTPSVTVEAR